jgi:hypothetical protein
MTAYRATAIPDYCPTKGTMDDKEGLGVAAL